MLASDVVVRGTRADVADASWRLFLVDVTTPSAPAVRGYVSLSGAAFSVAVHGARAAVVTKGPFEDFLELVDVATPTAPARQATLALGPPATAHSVALTATHAYVGNTTAGLRAFELTAAGPSPRGALVESFLPLAVAAARGRAVVVGTDRFDTVAVLKVLDVTDPRTPTVLGTLRTSAAATFHGVAVDAAATRAVVTLGPAGLWTIDLADPATPRRLASLDTPGDARGVALVGTRAFVADTLSGLAVVDLATPAAPRLLATKPGALARHVAVAGPIAYVGDLSGRLFLFDVTTPTAPLLLTNRRLSGPVRDLAVAGSRVALVTGSSTGDFLDLLDIAPPPPPPPPRPPPPRPPRGPPPRAPPSAQGVALTPTRAFVATTAGIAALDLTDPTAPVQHALIPAVGAPLALVVDGTLAYVADSAATVSTLRLP
jgi:hypothetical protein